MLRGGWSSRSLNNSNETCQAERSSKMRKKWIASESKGNPSVRNFKRDESGAIIEKICPLCNLWLPADRFRVRKDTPSGLRPYCKECDDARTKAIAKAKFVPAPLFKTVSCKVCGVDFYGGRAKRVCVACKIKKRQEDLKRSREQSRAEWWKDREPKNFNRAMHGDDRSKITHKPCPCCKTNLPLSAFREDKTAWIGRSSHCRECLAKKKKEWNMTPKGREARIRNRRRMRKSPSAIRSKRKRAGRAVTELWGKYIAKLLNLKFSSCPPELIDTKRQQVKILRELKTTTKQQNAQESK